MLTKIKYFLSGKFISSLYLYITNIFDFISLGGSISNLSPIFKDRYAMAGSGFGHYFHQDLLVANYIYLASPSRHIDIASRIDGFTAHVASFRKIEVMDIRSLDSTGHDNIVFIQRDLMNIQNSEFEITDSISCLHAIEHFGLGRYGDTVNPNGHIVGFNNLLKLLKVGGILYISFPIGNEDLVLFNSQRIFNPKSILSWAYDKKVLNLKKFDYVNDSGQLVRSASVFNLPDMKYGCGIYTFEKLY